MSPNWLRVCAASVVALGHCLVVTAYICIQLDVPVNVSVNTNQLAVTTPNNQTQLTGLVQAVFSETSNVSTQLVGKNLSHLTRTYTIWSQLCLPDGFIRGTLEFAIHGINLDHFYWEYGGQGSDQNYVEAALAAGHAIFTFDRLGTGMSSQPDGINEVQTSTEIAVLAQLIRYLRGGLQGLFFDRIVAVGHSYGSFLLPGLAARYGNIVDDIVLTSFSTATASYPTVFAGLGLGIASQVNASLFRSLDASYMATASIINIQQMFFYFPQFDEASLDFAEEHKGVFTVGELLTIAQPLVQPATDFTGSIFVVTGAKDFVVCGGNCFQSVNGSPDLIQPSSALFPSASQFSYNIPADTGHLINGHFSAPQTYQVIQQWIGA